MSRTFADGRKAWGHCARSGIKMMLKDMVYDGYYPDLLVHPDWYEPRHPQEYLPPVTDPVALRDPTGDLDPDEVLNAQIVQSTTNAQGDLIYVARFPPGTKGTTFEDGGYYSKTNGLKGTTQSSTGTLVMSVNFTTLGSEGVALSSTDLSFDVRKTAGDIIKISGKNSNGTPVLDIRGTVSVIQGAWTHIQASWDLTTDTAHLYINDISSLSTTTLVNSESIDYTVADWAVGADILGADNLDGCLSELWFDDVFINVSASEERRKFLNADLSIPDFGADGALPTGNKPIIYMPAGDASDNRGVGGDDFTVTGTVAECAGPDA